MWIKTYCGSLKNIKIKNTQLIKKRSKKSSERDWTLQSFRAYRGQRLQYDLFLQKYRYTQKGMYVPDFKG